MQGYNLLDPLVFVEKGKSLIVLDQILYFCSLYLYV